MRERDRERKREREREREFWGGRKRAGAMQGCRGNASLLSLHHKVLIVSNPLTHTVITDTHTHTHTIILLAFSWQHAKSAEAHTKTQLSYWYLSVCLSAEQLLLFFLT